MSRVKWMAWIVLGALASPVVAFGQEVAGVLGITPSAPGTCIAVRAQVPSGYALEGFRWYNNDGYTVFPEFSVVPVGSAGLPDSNSPLVTWHDVSGPSSDWGELTTGGLLVEDVFLVIGLPTTVRDGTGAGTGPGIGYMREPGLAPVLVKPGQEDGWQPIDAGISMAIEPILASLTLGKASLPVEEGTAVHFDTSLSAPQPNPSNPSTEIRYSLRVPGTTELAVYDVRGRLVRRLAGGTAQRGDHTVVWHGLDESGAPVASGVYFIRLHAEGEVFQKRVTLVR